MINNNPCIQPQFISNNPPAVFAGLMARQSKDLHCWLGACPDKRCGSLQRPAVNCLPTDESWFGGRTTALTRCLFMGVFLPPSLSITINSAHINIGTLSDILVIASLIMSRSVFALIYWNKWFAILRRLSPSPRRPQRHLPYGGASLCPTAGSVGHGVAN